ncbi:MAG TPA: PD-(D/E)XK nuclease family protein [Geobacterales bacterium]|nr:PD-(D/E)XK nuclease family protein [Geobacterales bacterium]
MIIHYLSASRLKTYLQCSEKYFQTYENKVKSDAVHLRFGTMIHKVFERWFQEDKDIRNIYEEEWRKADVVDPQYYKDGIEIVEKFVTYTDKNKILSLGFEVPFAINIEDDIVLDVSNVDFNDGEQAKAFLKKLEEDEKPYIFGFIDRIDFDPDSDTLYIIDYKTSRVPLDKEAAKTDEQLSMYALVAKYLYPEYENVVLQLQYVRFGDFLSTTRTEEELKVFKQWLINMYYIILNDASPKPTVNNYCGWCDSRHGCVGYQEIVKGELEDFNIEEIENLDEELSKISLKIKILDGRKKEIEDRLKEILRDRDNEPINVNGTIISLKNNKRTNYDVGTVINLFPDKFDSLLTVKKGEVDKLAKGNEEVQKILFETAEHYYISPQLTKKKEKNN